MSRNSVPAHPGGNRRSIREPLDAVGHVIGVGLVFPVSKDTAANVDYVTANIRDLGVEEPDAPDEADEPAEEAEVTAP